MQKRRTDPDHHQAGSEKAGPAYFSPEDELIALARSKGQVLTEHTLRLIRETLELRGVSLAEFVADARPHFRNNILNPSGFLINRARNFNQLSRPARAYPARGPVEVTGETCPGVQRKQIHHERTQDRALRGMFNSRVPGRMETERIRTRQKTADFIRLVIRLRARLWSARARNGVEPQGSP